VSQAHPDYRNRLLAILNVHEVALLEPRFERVALVARQTLEAPNTQIDYVYFPEHGICSVMGKLSHGRDMELAMIGREGMTGIALVQGDDRSPHQTMVYSDGVALRLGADQFRAALAQSPSMRGRLNLYARALELQLAAVAWAVGSSSLEQRLARWLLMVRDRLERERFSATHETIASKLGVHRPSITLAIGALKEKALIQSRSREITILDRRGLIEMADEAYGLPEREYLRLFSGVRTTPHHPVLSGT
jgi:CRP-like cAMP-binding protein